MTTVAYVCADPGVPVFGTKGASVHVQELLRAWRRSGAAVRLYCTRTGSEVPADLADVDVVHVPVDGVDDRGLAPVERTAARERRQREAADELARRAVADGVDLVHERYSLFSTALARVTAELGVPGVLEVNAPLVEEQREHRHLVDEAGAWAALRTQARAATRVGAVSEPVARWVREHTGLGPDDPRVVVTPNGVNTERVRPVRGAADGPPVVLFVGTLKPWHGVEVLLEAAALAERPWRLRIVGDGPMGPELRRRAGELGLDAEFTGALPPADVPAAMAGARVAVAPYPAGSDEQQYFSPLKVYEYAAAGLPVVASAVGQLPAVVRPGRTGLLVPPSDPAALAAAVDDLLGDPARADRMGDAARALMVRAHSWDAVLDRTAGGLTRRAA